MWGAIRHVNVKAKLALSAFMLLGVTVTANANPYVLTLEQDGPNVVATGTGEIDLTGLGFYTNTVGNGVLVWPSFDYTITGSGAGIAIYYPLVSIKGPSNYGSGDYTGASTSKGDNVGLSGQGQELFVPIGYVSDSPLSDSATYDDATFASLGITPGTYVWTWGTGADQSYTIDVGSPSAVPLPTTLALFAPGVGGLMLFGWRRKRKA
jgi:hypothetical protein